MCAFLEEKATPFGVRHMSCSSVFVFVAISYSGALPDNPFFLNNGMIASFYREDNHESIEGIAAACNSQNLSVVVLIFCQNPWWLIFPLEPFSGYVIPN